MLWHSPYAAETWTLLAADMKALEAFHVKCQQIQGIRWFVTSATRPNIDVRACTGLNPHCVK